MQNYFIFDGRANYDIDSAMVLEVFEAKSDHAAVKYHARNYKGEDTVLTDADQSIIY